jgi:hypothetical protein
MLKKTFNYCTLGILIFSSPILYAQSNSKTAKPGSSSDSSQLIGRWDLELLDTPQPTPSWLEVEHSGVKALVGRYVGAFGSVRPISTITFDNGNFSFSIPPQWERNTEEIRLTGKLVGDQIEGKLTNHEGQPQPFRGVRAPSLKREKAPNWGQPMDLFNGSNLEGWRPSGANSHWQVRNGILTNARQGANLISEKVFNDFQLHIEFRYPPGGNSGIYLRGRHEIQIEDNKKEAPLGRTSFGAIYGFLTPSEWSSTGPSEWQVFDISLIGRMVSITANGKTIISNQEIPGITGGALDSQEAAAGPIYLQGDHSAIEFRKIVITPAR